MRLLPLDTSDLIRLVAGWMSQEENYKWLDFGNGRQRLTAEWLAIASQRSDEVLRVFTHDKDDAPIGIVGLSDVDRIFGTARVWSVAGDKSFRARGHATRAVSMLMTHGFRELGLRAINTWIVDTNPSLRMAMRLNFTLIGRQRQCHLLDGRPYDRLWFDILASEHKEYGDA